ncbi:hypothetical protein Tco_0749985 [Tanacetum coccineum]|uniref:MAK10-like protein n=1 Tax=Tanacetum coccineum TaxID=301880 RepID=A0ABQ4Z021_9ASTR
MAYERTTMKCSKDEKVCKQPRDEQSSFQRIKMTKMVKAHKKSILDVEIKSPNQECPKHQTRKSKSFFGDILSDSGENEEKGTKYQTCLVAQASNEDPNQHLKDFLKLVDSLNLDSENRERMRLRTIDQSVGGKLRDRNAEESWALLEDLAFYDNESWNDPRDFAKPVKVISLPQDVPSTFDHFLIELESQVQHLMEAHLAPMQPTQVNKITSSCEICSGPHDTQYCIENPEQAFVEYASSRTNKAGGLVSNFMASQDARFSKFEANFKQQHSEMTNKIDTVLKAITDRIARALPSDMVKNPKLNTSPVSSVRSYPTKYLQCSTHIHGSINTIAIHPKQQSDSHDDKTEENEGEEKNNQEDINTNPSTPPNPSVSFITKKVLKLNLFFESLGLATQLSGI